MPDEIRNTPTAGSSASLSAASTGACRVALFGGSFDPPHSGHLAIAQAARSALALDAVLFAPVGAQPLKPAGSTAPFRDRVAMTRLAIASEPAFSVSLLDAPKPAGAHNYTPNYTIDTLHTLRAQLAPASTLFFLMGADSLRGFRRWHRAAEIPFAAALIIAARPGESLTELAALLPSGLSLTHAQPPHAQPTPMHPSSPEHSSSPGQSAPPPQLLPYTVTNSTGSAAPLYVLPGLHFDVSATAIRAQLHSRHAAFSNSALLPPPVADYIARHRLYRAASLEEPGNASV